MIQIDPQRDGRWWLAEELGREPHDMLEPIVSILRNRQGRRRIVARRNAMYFGADPMMFGGGSSVGEYDEEVLTLNAAENAIDTVASKVCKNRVLPVAMTDGGTFEEQVRAKNFNHFIEGFFNESGIYDLDMQMVYDALLFDAAVWLMDEEDDKIRVGRVPSIEISVDESESRYGTPRSWFRTRRMDRMQLLEMYKDDDEEKRKAILNVAIDRLDDDVYFQDMASDMVVVQEAWHLPSGPDAEDGQYVRWVKGCTLEKARYELSSAPFVLMSDKPPIAGLWNRPMMSRLIPAQREFDKMNRRIQACVDMIGVPRIVVSNGSNIRKSSISDELASVLETDDINGIRDWNAEPLHQQVFAYRNQLPMDMLRFAGISEMSASSQVPRGITAARALETLNEAESERLVPFWNMRDKAYIQLAYLGLELARKLSKRNPDYSVLAPNGRKGVKRVRFADVDISQDKYVIQVFATSLLAKSPSARYEQLTEMRMNGDITPRQYKRELGNPDLDAEMSLEGAPEELVDMQIAKILLDGEMVTVEPTDPHELIVQRGTLSLSRAKIDEVPRDRWENLLRYVQAAQGYMERASSPAPEPVSPPGPPGIPPQGPETIPPPTLQGAAPPPDAAAGYFGPNGGVS